MLCCTGRIREKSFMDAPPPPKQKDDRRRKKRAQGPLIFIQDLNVKGPVRILCTGRGAGCENCLADSSTYRFGACYSEGTRDLFA